MASKQSPASPGSDVDERKRKRILSNRESARRSRMRKQKHLDDLIAQVSKMQEENKKLRGMIDNAAYSYVTFSSENNVMRDQLAKMASRLRCLNSVLEIASEVGGLSIEIPVISDTLMEPWQRPYQVQPIPNRFHC